MTQIVTDCFFPAVQIWAQQLYEGLGSNLTLPRAGEDPESPRGSRLFLLSLILLKTPRQDYIPPKKFSDGYTTSTFSDSSALSKHLMISFSILNKCFHIVLLPFPEVESPGERVYKLSLVLLPPILFNAKPSSRLLRHICHRMFSPYGNSLVKLTLLQRTNNSFRMSIGMMKQIETEDIKLLSVRNLSVIKDQSWS